MKSILIALIMSGLLSLPVANTNAESWPWKPKNKKCHVLSQGNVMVEKTKKDRIVKKKYHKGDKVEETIIYANGKIDHKYY